MKCRLTAVVLFACGLVLIGVPAFAQGVANLDGRITDPTAGALPGVSVTVKQQDTGLTRNTVTGQSGDYRFTALPIGLYDLTAELQGFAKYEQRGVILSIGQTITLNLVLKIAQVAETITVEGQSPIIETTSSSVGGVVDVKQLNSLPLNDRQFANLAAQVPGVVIGFHSDPTKATQYSPQIGGGNGRNVNYLIDGGDNNDDTVGGILQAFPLEAIQEFNFITQRYKAEYGRSNGGVLSAVTKSGTNHMTGSWFTQYRNDKLNSRTTTEKDNNIAKQKYRRYQFGGSVGGPISKDHVFFFAAFERTQSDTFQSVSTKALFPDKDGVFGVPYRENFFSSKVSAEVTPTNMLSVRYGRNNNSNPYGVGTLSPPESWGTSENRFYSVNGNLNSVIGSSKLNEFIFQYAIFRNHIGANSLKPSESFPNGVFVGQSPNVPQTTEQHKLQLRDDFSWHKSGGGVSHDFKTGFNFIYEPRLFITFNVGTGDFSYTHVDNTLTGPIRNVSKNGGSADANIPTKQLGLYFQDDWRPTTRLTLNLGVRYDLNTGFAIDQSRNPNFVKLQNAAKAGRFNGIPGFEDFGKSAAEDRNNIEPRIGMTYDLKGDGKDILRAGWGIYYDFGYTNANVLFAAVDATGIGSGVIFSVTDTAGIRKPDGTFFHVGDPISLIASQNEVSGSGLPLIGHIASPRIKQPFTRQASAGWSHELNSTTAIDADFVFIQGRDIAWRPRLNQRLPGTFVSSATPRRFADLGLSPANFRIDISNGRTQYEGFNIGIRRRYAALNTRALKGLQFNASYTISRARGTGSSGTDELDSGNILDVTNPFGNPAQFGPSNRTDARHKFNLGGVFEFAGGVRVSPNLRFRSALPFGCVLGYDGNLDGVSFDLPPGAATINSCRGAKSSQLNIRAAKVFRITGSLHVEGFVDVFNVYNAKNPSGFLGSEFTGTFANHSPNPVFGRPTVFSGDAQQPEQRLAQIGFRIAF